MASRTLPGQMRSGDRHLVKQLPRGVMLAVVDGLGHGDEAALSAEIAVGALDGSEGESLIALVRRCHTVLRGRRGVVIGLASFDASDETMTWLGVGNVAGRLLRGSAEAAPRCESLLLRSGVLGGDLPPLVASVLSVAPGDTLALATDGIRDGFADQLDPKSPPQLLADRILARHARKTDDALVLVARYAPGTHA